MWALMATDHLYHPHSQHRNPNHEGKANLVLKPSGEPTTQESFLSCPLVFIYLPSCMTDNDFSFGQMAGGHSHILY